MKIYDVTFQSLLNAIPKEVGSGILKQSAASHEELQKLSHLCHALNRWVWQGFSQQGISRARTWTAGPRGLQKALINSQGLTTLCLTNRRHFAACLTTAQESKRYALIDSLVLEGKAQEPLDSATIERLQQFSHLRSLTLKNLTFTPKTLETLPKVKQLHLINCQVQATTEELFDALATQTELKSLDIQECYTTLASRISYSSKNLPQLATLPNLESLYGRFKQVDHQEGLVYKLLDKFPKLQRVSALPFGDLFLDGAKEQVIPSPDLLPEVIKHLFKQWENDKTVLTKLEQLKDKQGMNLFSHIVSELIKAKNNRAFTRRIDQQLRQFPANIRLFDPIESHKLASDKHLMRLLVRYSK